MGSDTSPVLQSFFFESAKLMRCCFSLPPARVSQVSRSAKLTSLRRFAKRTDDLEFGLTRHPYSDAMMGRFKFSGTDEKEGLFLESLHFDISLFSVLEIPYKIYQNCQHNSTSL